jgi:hypothetical protein
MEMLQEKEITVTPLACPLLVTQDLATLVQKKSEAVVTSRALCAILSDGALQMVKRLYYRQFY